MSEADVLDRPIAENPEKLQEIRQQADLSIEYSEAVRKDAERRGIILPTGGKLRDALEGQARKLVDNKETERKKRNENVPDIVLRNQDKEGNWEDLGWSEEERRKVKDKLREYLKFSGKEDEGRLENLLHMLIASGKTPEDILPVLTDTSQWTYYETEEEGQKKVMMYAANDRHVFYNNYEAAHRYVYLKEKLGLTNEANAMNEVYLKRFILDDDFREELNVEYDQQLPRNIFDLAWNIMYHEVDKYGLNGKFPVLQMQVRYKKDKEGNPVFKKDSDGKVVKDKNGNPLHEIEGRYVVNEANFVRWLRDRMFYRYDAFETDEVPNYYSVITVDKGAYATVNLSTMIFDKARYFRDETGYEWEGLYNQVFIEPWMLIFDRQYALDYDKGKGNDEELIKTYTAMAHQSKFTRKVIGQSMLDRSVMLPLDYTGSDSDAKLGEALLTMYLAYYNLADFEALEEILGKDSPFFTRDAWVKAAQGIASKTMNATGGAWMSAVFGAREDNFYKAFDKDGNVGTDKERRKAFIKLINPYYQETVPQTLTKALAEMLKTSVRDKFESKQGTKDEKGKAPIDEDSLNYAWLKAYSWMYFTGGIAKNNFVDSGGPAGYLAETKYDYTDAYRLKYETYGGAGNFFTDFMFKQMGIPLLEGMLLENAFERTEEGKRYRTPMEVMLQMRRKAYEFEVKIKPLQEKLRDASLSEIERRRTQAEIDLLEDEAKNYTKTYAGMLEFGDNAMSVWAKNLLARGSNLYNQVMKGQETAFDKFMKYDSVFRGVSFDREAWQSALQDKLITPLRYFFEANGATQLNMKVRAPQLVGWKGGKPQWEWKEQYLGERMMGHQILDIPEFRFKADDISPEKWAEFKKQGLRKRGKYIVDKDGRHIINYDEVQKEKTVVWKQWMLMKIAADLWSHIDRHSTDPAYSMDHYMNILEAIENLHGNVIGNEFDLKDSRVTQRLFDHHQIKWLKEMSGTTTTRLFTRQMLTDIFADKHRKGTLFDESTSVILGYIFRGK